MNTTPGRKANAAQPLGKPPTQEEGAGRRKTVERSRDAAGPDGPDAGVVGETFKRRPG